MNTQMIICSNCKTPNPAKNLYCQSCGRPLIPAAPTATTFDVTQPSLSQPAPRTVPDSAGIPPGPAAPTQPMTPPAEQPYAPPVQQADPAGGQPIAPAVYAANIPPQAGAQTEYGGSVPPQVVPPAYGGTPPQQGYPNYTATPPREDIFQRAQAGTETFLSRLRNGTFNVHLDEWSDLYPGAGEKAGEVERSFVEILNGRQISNFELARTEVSSGLLARNYQVLRHRSGTVSVFVNPAGKDLAVGWEAQATQKVNWKMIGVLALTALGISFLVNLATGWIFGRFLVEWIFGIFSWILPVIAIGLVAGKIINGDIWYMFIEKADAAGQQELAALTKAAHLSLLEAVKRAGLK